MRCCRWKGRSDQLVSSSMPMVVRRASLPALILPSPPGFIEHKVSKLDTLTGIAIKYGVEATDLQMFARRSLQIPLPDIHHLLTCQINLNLNLRLGRYHHPPLLFFHSSVRFFVTDRLSLQTEKCLSNSNTPCIVSSVWFISVLQSNPLFTSQSSGGWRSRT